MMIFCLCGNPTNSCVHCVTRKALELQQREGFKRGFKEGRKDLFPLLKSILSCGVLDKSLISTLHGLEKEIREALSCGPECSWSNEEVVYCECNHPTEPCPYCNHGEKGKTEGKQSPSFCCKCGGSRVRFKKGIKRRLPDEN